MNLIRLLVLCMLIAVLASLASALWYLSSGRHDSRRMLRALRWRIGLSVALFALLLLAASRGWITPHGLGR